MGNTPQFEIQYQNLANIKIVRRRVDKDKYKYIGQVVYYISALHHFAVTND